MFSLSRLSKLPLSLLAASVEKFDKPNRWSQNLSMERPKFLTSGVTQKQKRIYIAVALTLIIFVIILFHLHDESWRAAIVKVKEHLLSGSTGVGAFTKPEGLKVIAIVFFGRVDRISILDCYLRQNLVHNGGWLDEVIFVVNRHSPDSMAWLDLVVSNTPGYTKWDGCTNCGFKKAWKIAHDGPMYIKIDDDVVFFEDTVIPSVVTTLYNNPEYFAVTANIINQPRMSWIHARYGAVHNYLPEQKEPEGEVNATSWRASELPMWEGPKDYDFTQKFNAPFPGHRWLPLPPGSDPYRTPIASSTYDAAGPGWYNWAVASQQHASFFQNLENGELWRYDHGTWVFWAEQFSIQFVAVWGKTILDYPLSGEDEKDMTIHWPKKLGRHCAMAGGGVVVHFAHGAQYGSGLPDGHGIEWTNFLEMYRDYAKEKICK